MIAERGFFRINMLSTDIYSNGTVRIRMYFSCLTSCKKNPGVENQNDTLSDPLGTRFVSHTIRSAAFKYLTASLHATSLLAQIKINRKELFAPHSQLKKKTNIAQSCRTAFWHKKSPRSAPGFNEVLHAPWVACCKMKNNGVCRSRILRCDFFPRGSARAAFSLLSAPSRLLFHESRAADHHGHFEQ